jgi:hypothetical protein
MKSKDVFGVLAEDGVSVTIFSLVALYFFLSLLLVCRYVELGYK